MDATDVVKKLIEKQKTISTAESCTGGTIGSMITAVPGSSEVYGYGFITYANEAKEKLIGVKHETLQAYGAVSEQTAREMAQGALAVSGSDIAVSVTGIAGPGGGTAEKPVGLVYTALADKNGIAVWENRFCGDRDAVRKQACDKVITDIIKYLEKI